MLTTRPAVVVRTHGGLGNQLFQIAYARLLAARSGRPLIRLHDSRYPNRPPRSSAFGGLDEDPGITIRLVSGLRMPKMARRLGLLTGERVQFRHTFLDGYFQNQADYAPFSDSELRDVAEQLRAEFSIVGRPHRGILEHIRLGDFFRTEEDRVRHLMDRISSTRRGATVITDSDELLTGAGVRKFLEEQGIRVESTSGLTAEQTLQFMASFRAIRSNNSTLACWAAILGRADIEIIDSRLHLLTTRWRDASS